MQSRELAARFEAYGDWRRRLSSRIALMHRWLDEQELADAQVEAKVRHLQDRLQQDKLTVAKMNVDENRDIPAKFGIRGIPTLMLFKGGQLAATKVGAMSKAQLTAFIDQQLA